MLNRVCQRCMAYSRVHGLPTSRLQSVLTQLHKRKETGKGHSSLGFVYQWFGEHLLYTLVLGCLSYCWRLGVGL